VCLIILFLIIRVDTVLQKIVSSCHGNLLLFFSSELLEAKEQKVLEVCSLLLNVLSHTDIHSLSAGSFSELHDVDELGFIEQLHDSFIGNLNKELFGLGFDETSKVSMRILFSSFGKENFGADLIGDELFVVESEFSEEDFIFRGSFNLGHHFWWLGSGNAFSSVDDAKSRAG